MAMAFEKLRLGAALICLHVLCGLDASKIDDVLRLVERQRLSGSEVFQSRNLCENQYDDVGLCVSSLECTVTRGINIGVCHGLGGHDGRRGGAPGVCCHYLPCSVPQVLEKPSDLDLILRLGLRNARDLRNALQLPTFLATPILPAKIETCGLRKAAADAASSNKNAIPIGGSGNDDLRFSQQRHRLRERRNRHLTGLNRNGHIIRGDFAAPSSTPWMLALWVKTRSGNTIPTCGAALIAPDYALTAAHCVHDSDVKYVLRGGSNFNRLTLQPPPENRSNRRNRFLGSGFETAGVSMEVDEVIVHPKFNPFNFEHDIALIRLKKRVRFSRDLFPVCLPAPVVDGQDVTDYAGESALVTGWGCQSEGCQLSNVPSLLQETVMPVISNELAMCWFHNDSVRAGKMEYIPSKLFLVGGDDSGSTSTCRGDSGSPVVRQRPTITTSGSGTDNGDGGGRWEVVGLVSWSKGCGRPFRPSVWTRVETFVDWIITNME